MSVSAPTITNNHRIKLKCVSGCTVTLTATAGNLAGCGSGIGLAAGATRLNAASGTIGTCGSPLNVKSCTVALNAPSIFAVPSTWVASQ